MRKLVYRAFGGVDVLDLAEVATPEPRAGELLVRVMAAGINPADRKLREGQLKILSGWRMPQGLGLEFAGVVARVGPGVQGYAVGDEVFGAGRDCIADYCVAKVGRVAKKPPGVSFAIASTIAAVGTTAASVFDRAKIGTDTDVLVNGATGGIGSLAMQMAVRRGARVTAVVSGKGAALAERWGAARVVNYRDTRVLDEGRVYDVVVELSDKLSFRRAKAILGPRGTFVASMPSPGELVAGYLGNWVSSRKYALMSMRPVTEVLSAVASEVAAGNLEVVVSRTFSLEEYREAYTPGSNVVGKTAFVTEPTSVGGGRAVRP